MKKLKCTSCGAGLEVEENKEYAKCNHCGTRYKLNEDLNINVKIDNNTKETINKGINNASKFMFMPIAMFIVVALIMIMMSIHFFSDSISKKDNYKEENIKSSFNFQFVHDNGTKDAIFVESTLDEIIQSNKTYDRKVTLKFEGKETTNEKEIIDIKHSLNGEYEVSIDYDNDGYINIITVEKINTNED